MASMGAYHIGAYLILAGMVFDFGDGLTARALKVQSEIGKQLDSLSDLITFGLAPAYLLFAIMSSPLTSLFADTALDIDVADTYFVMTLPWWIILSPFLMTVFSALRLAKFNVDDSQSTEFKGLATPANALFWTCFVLSMMVVSFNPVGTSFYISDIFIDGQPLDATPDTLPPSSSFVLILAPLIFTVFSILLVAPIRMFAFKFKHLAWKGNEVRYIFIAIVLLTITGALLIKNLFLAGPIIILLYIVISMINNLFRKKNEIQS